MKKPALTSLVSSCFMLLFAYKNAFAGCYFNGGCEQTTDPYSQAEAQFYAQCYDRRVDIAHMETQFEYPSELSFMQREQLRNIRHPNIVTIAADYVIARPVMIATTVAGTGLFVATLPFSAMGGNVHQAAYELVGVPFQESFTRCLGCNPSDFGEHAYFGYY